jgi:hypothetical protein
LTVAYATRVVTSADLDPTGPSTPLTDEYGRPLRLIYGFVARQAVAEVADEDLAAAYDVAIAVYRRFLRDEDALTVAMGQSFPLRSRLARPAAAAPPPSAGPARSARSSPPRRRPVALALGVVAAALAGTAIVVTLVTNRPHPLVCPTPSASTVIVGAPSPDPSDSCAPSPAPSRTRLSG